MTDSHIARKTRAVVKSVLPTHLHPEELAAQFIQSKTKGQIISGPFAGLRYVTEGVGSKYYPKVLGTYELELHPIVEEIIRQNFPLIVNIGAGEGYYAVGLAQRNPNVHIVAYEAERHGQELIGEFARINHVENQISVRGYCGTNELAEILDGASRACLIVDVEGAETTLLDLEKIPALRQAVMLIEIHNAFVPNTDVILEQRFAATHDIQTIPARVRKFDDFPIPVPFYQRALKRYFEMQMGERPAGMSWLYLKPKARA